MNIIEMAKQAGPLITTPFDQWCENFAVFVRAHALEEAARVCDDKHDEWRFGDGEDAASGPKDCAAAIRAMKESKT